MAVIGPGMAGPELCRLAYEVGAELARRQAILLCGGLGGVMEAAARGAREASGRTIGLLPGTDRAASLPDQTLIDAMQRLERSLAVVAPPPLSEAADAASCPAEGVRELERSGRIVVLDGDLAYATTTYDEISATALRLAAAAPLTPAALRDATGTSRKYVMAILEDLDRRAILRRTPGGHVPGPRAARSAVTAP